MTDTSSWLLPPGVPPEAPRCTGTTRRGTQCRHSARPWPQELEGDPQRCGNHMPRDKREIRKVWLDEQERRHQELLDARVPACWSWDPAVPLESIHAKYAASFSLKVADAFLRRFHSGEERALQLVLAEWHDDRCAVCGGRGERVIDHDHDTGLIRGFLCRSCNGLEPHDNGLFRRYREKSPAQILGIRLLYVDPIYGVAEPRTPRRDQLDDHASYRMEEELLAAMQALSEG